MDGGFRDAVWIRELDWTGLASLINSFEWRSGCVPPTPKIEPKGDCLSRIPAAAAPLGSKLLLTSTYAHAEFAVASLSADRASDVRPAEGGPENSQIPPIGRPPPTNEFTGSLLMASNRGAWIAWGDSAEGIREVSRHSISLLKSVLLDCVGILFAFCSPLWLQHTPPCKVKVNPATLYGATQNLKRTLPFHIVKLRNEIPNIEHSYV